MDANTVEFQNIFEDFQPKIFRYIRRLVGEAEAEDLTQEVFLKVSEALEKFRGESQLSTWIYRIATNTALDRLRSPSFQHITQASLSGGLDEREIADQAITPEDEKPLIEKQLIREEMNECIRSYVEKLPESYRTVLVLSEWEELKNNEIAEILGVPLHLVKIRLHRAKTKLKEELETHCEFYWVEEMPCPVI